MLSILKKKNDTRKAAAGNTTAGAPENTANGGASSKPVSSIPPGQVELIKTDEPTAAVIMAIVSNKSEIPLERLHFIRIKQVEDHLQ